MINPSDVNDTIPGLPSEGIAAPTRRGPQFGDPLPLDTGRETVAQRTEEDIPTVPRATFMGLVLKVNDAEANDQPVKIDVMRQDGLKVQASHFGRTDPKIGTWVEVHTIREPGNTENDGLGEVPVKYVIPTVPRSSTKVGMAKITSVPAETTEVLELEPDVTVDIKTATATLEEHYRSVDNPGGSIDLVFPNIGTHTTPKYHTGSTNNRVPVVEWTKGRWLVIGPYIGNNFLAYAGSGIPARSGTTLGKATCDIQIIDTANDTVSSAAGGVTVYNPHDVAIPAGFYFIAIEDPYGNYVAQVNPLNLTNPIIELKATEAFEETDATFTGEIVGPSTAVTIKNINVTPAASAFGMDGNNGDSVYGYLVSGTTYQAIQKACT